jgi:hypothetical protein
VARQAWQICRDTWRLNVGDGAVLWHRPGCLGKGIMTELTFARGQRPKYGWALVSRGSRAQTWNDVELLQTLAARETADKRVKLSAEASRVVTGIRSASHPHAVRARCGRHAPGPTAPMAYERHLALTTSGAPAMNGSQPAPVAPAGENAPAEVVLARIRAERDASQRGQQRINRQDPIKKPRRRRIRRSAVAPIQGVTAPDLPEGI